MDVITIVKRSPLVFSLAVVAAVAMMFLSETSYRRSVVALNEMSAIAQARGLVRDLHASILDAESGQRGYLLTGRDEYLLGYRRTLGKLDQSFNVLGRYYAGDHESLEAFARLRVAAKNKLSELAQAIRLYDEGKREAATNIVLSSASNVEMEAITALTAELRDRESQSLESRRADLYLTLRQSRIGIALLSAISLLALFMYLRQTFALERQRQTQQHLLRAERDRLEIEVAQRTAQLTELTHHLQTAREDERNRLARDLHDELGALLTSAKLDAARIKPRLVAAAPEVQERLAHLVGTLDSSIALGRRIIEDLRPSTLSHLGLVATLEIFAREFSERSGVEVHCTLAPVKLAATTELVVYRLLQEAVTNITKYAKARNVWVNLAANDGQVEISVRDDGVGFDASARPGSAYGLVGMRFRVEAEGGTMVVVSAPGQGTLIRVTLPRSAEGTA